MYTTLCFTFVAIPSAFALTATSWGKGRLDVFGLFPIQTEYSEYWHKYYTSQGGWEPHGGNLESLEGPPTNARAHYKDVSSVSWGEDHLDFFATVDGTLSHVFWNPHDNKWIGWDDLPEDGSSTYLKGAPSTASWGSGRIDVVSRDDEGKYLHLYYNHDNEEWKGWEDPWNSPSNFESDPVVIAPDKDHFDVFGRLANGTIVHLYWNGKEHSKWDHLTWKAPEIGWNQYSSLSASTWKNGSWDLWALAADNSLWHTFWRGAPVNEFFGWENLTDDIRFDETPNAVHWSPEHTDVFGVSSGTYYHRYWDNGWTEWTAFGSVFASPPEVVSWGEGHYAVFGIKPDGELWGAMYVNGQWRDWEKLGDVTPEVALGRGKVGGGGEQVVLEGWKQGL